MNCLRCGSDATYNRAVFDLRVERQVGGYCEECERTAFGESLVAGSWEGRDGCLLCDRGAQFALPVHKLDIYEDEGGEVVDSHYRVVDETPTVCGRHLTQLVGTGFQLELSELEPTPKP